MVAKSPKKRDGPFVTPGPSTTGGGNQEPVVQY